MGQLTTFDLLPATRDDTIQQARLVVCQHSTAVADARLLLDMLGLLDADLRP